MPRRDSLLTVVPDEEPDAIVVAMDDVLDVEAPHREEAQARHARLVVRTDDRKGLRRE